MSKAQQQATARYKAKQLRVDALINPETEPELAEAWEALLHRFGGSKKKAIAWAILNAKAPAIPSLPRSARQPKTPPECEPTCSAGSERLFDSMLPRRIEGE